MRRSVKPLAAAALLLALCLLLLPAPARATGPLWLPRQSFAAGETATASFAIVGGTPPYSVQSVTWLIREQDGQAYEQQGTVGSSSASYTLFYGVSGFCQVRVKDAAGTEASGQTMEFTISGASFHPLQATLTLGAASVSYGQEVWADWRITSGVPPYMLDWAWHFIEPDGFTSAIEGSKVESVASGRLSCKPEVGPQGYLLLSLRDKAGHALTLSTERFDILGAPPPPEPVNCAPMVSPQRVALGQPVTASWAVTGGVAPYTVLGAWEEGGARTADQGLSASGSTSYTPGRLGQGRFLLSVRDARGRAYDFSSPSFTIYDPAQASPLQVTLRLSADSVAAGGSLLATAEVAGGLPPYTYSFEHGCRRRARRR